MSVQQHIEVSDTQGVTLVRLLDRQLMDGDEIENTGHELFQLVESEDRRRLVLDLSFVEFLASAALGKLIALHKRVAAKNGVVKLCSMRPEVLEIFAITKLDHLFGIEANVADALAGFG